MSWYSVAHLEIGISLDDNRSYSCSITPTKYFQAGCTYCTILWADGGTGQILISGQSGLCYGDNSDRVTFYRTSSAETKSFQKGFLVLHLEKTEFLLRVLAFFPMMQLYYSFWYFRILHFV